MPSIIATCSFAASAHAHAGLFLRFLGLGRVGPFRHLLACSWRSAHTSGTGLLTPPHMADAINWTTKAVDANG